jgi:ergothioneine biosynthesis protein EgtB
MTTERLTSGASRATAESHTSLLEKYRVARHWTEVLCEPLATEDYVVQSMPDASPVKWHLAHTTWFFETFVLTPFLSGYRPFHPQFSVLFNSYYTAVGPRWPRAERGLLSRPTVAEVYRYRTYVDEHVTGLLESAAQSAEVEARMTLGVNHEQQHQELILTDLKHAWAGNPLHPVYRVPIPNCGEPPAGSWLGFAEGLAWIGHDGDGFAFDNECPRHRIFLDSYQLANRLVTNEEYLAFVADGGYDRPELWLSDGWASRQARGWKAAALLGKARHGMVDVHAGRSAAARARRTRLPRQLLRGGRVCPVGRRQAAERSGVGNGCSQFAFGGTFRGGRPLSSRGNAGSRR